MPRSDDDLAGLARRESGGPAVPPDLAAALDAAVRAERDACRDVLVGLVVRLICEASDLDAAGHSGGAALRQQAEGVSHAVAALRARSEPARRPTHRCRAAHAGQRASATPPCASPVAAVTADGQPVDAGTPAPARAEPMPGTVEECWAEIRRTREERDGYEALAVRYLSELRAVLDGGRA